MKAIHGNGFKNLIGQRFGRLLVLSLDESSRWRNIKWLCLCDCGNHPIIARSGLTTGKTKSCGCFQRERARDCNIKHGCAPKGNAMREYKIWIKMKERCLNPKSAFYFRYGGRGITVCQRWLHSFPAFLSDMGICPKGLTLNRVNNDGNYDPGNCNWATRTEQNNNTCRNRMLTWNGKTQSLAMWARETGQSQDCLWFRIMRRKWDLEKALTLPPQSK